jgi:hypothetical protein
MCRKGNLLYCVEHLLWKLFESLGAMIPRTTGAASQPGKIQVCLVSIVEKKSFKIAWIKIISCGT